MDTSGAILQASAAGSVNLLVLMAAGAILAHLGHWSPVITSTLSNAAYKISLPAMIFFPVLSSLTNARESMFRTGGAEVAVKNVLLPLLAPLPIFTALFFMARLFASIAASKKDRLVRRAIVVCIGMSNSFVLPLLVMNSLCTGLSSLQQDKTCMDRTTAFLALYLVLVFIFEWAVCLPYLTYISQENVTTSESSPLLRRHANIINQVPRFGDLFIAENAVLHPLATAIGSLGKSYIYFATFIVGAEVYEGLSTKYRALYEVEIETGLERDSITYEERTRGSNDSKLELGAFTMISIVFMRLVVFPALSRQVFSMLNASAVLGDPVLGLFLLTETNTVTANSAIVVISLATEGLLGKGRVGEVLRREVAILQLIQCLLAPIILTFNTVLNLKLVL